MQEAEVLQKLMLQLDSERRRNETLMEMLDRQLERNAELMRRLEARPRGFTNTSTVAGDPRVVDDPYREQVSEALRRKV